jgi:predicted MFS family arabinose efflux permease
MISHDRIDRDPPSRSPSANWLSVALAVGAVAWGANQFVPLLLVYRDSIGISASTAQATFGLYAAGLAPGLLVGGPFSDRHGRRPVLIAALIASALASGLLMVGEDGVGWLFAGRLLAGVASGAAFSAGSAWLKELSPGAAGARRATVSMTAGFAASPVAAGLLAQWAPAPMIVPYVPHLALAAMAIPLIAWQSESSARIPPAGGRAAVLHDRRFRSVVAPLAPWVFGSAAIPLAYLPSLVQSRLGSRALVFGAFVATVTALAGIAVQSLARRLDSGDGPRLLAAALGIVTTGLLVAAVAAATRSLALIVLAAIVLGAGYGCCQVCGLLEVQRLAPPDRLAGMTAAYQALSYTGFALPFLLASIAGVVAPQAGLAVLAGLAAFTLLSTTRAATMPQRT